MGLIVLLLVQAAIAQVVTLDYGKLAGSAANGYSQFLGIPYATAPTGPLRYKPPVLPIPMTGTYDATRFRDGCIPSTGPASGFSEDCLFLSVFAPTKSIASSTLLPVVVYIHGGSFVSGASGASGQFTNQFYNGTTFNKAAPSDRQSVIVTVNYRLGYLGFLASSDLAADGSLNLGLLDQRAALEWVQKYIRLFGGDASRVTVWGTSAGGRSIHHHMNAKTSGVQLFHRAIIESAAVRLQSSFVADTQNYYDTLASGLNCPRDSSASTLSCLRAASISDLSKVATKLPGKYYPVVDGTYIATSYLENTLSGNALAIPIIWLHSLDEGTSFALSGNANQSPEKALSFEKSSFGFLNASSLSSIQQIYPPSAFKPVGPYPSTFEAAAEAYGDAYYKCPIQVSSTAAISNHPSTPIYQTQWNFIAPKSSNQNIGVYHTINMPYTWGYKSSLADSDIPVSKAFIAAYSNFIYGNAPDTGGIGFTWPLFNTRQEVVLVDAKLSGETYVASAPFLAKCEFWKESALLWNAQGKGGQVNSSGDGNADAGGEVNPDVGGSFATATMTGTVTGAVSTSSQKGFSVLASVLLGWLFLVM